MRVLSLAALLTIAPAVAQAQPRPLPFPVWGVTIDDTSNISSQVSALNALPRKPGLPTVRVVFDKIAASNYTSPLSALRPAAYIMGELADSSDVRKYSIDSYLSRAKNYWAAHKDRVDVWEIGNEVNGEWLGTTSDVVAKIHGAWQYIHGQGGKTALTLYYNRDCWSRASHEMFTWTQANIPADMKAGVDYLLVSWYPYDCNGLTSENWTDVFTRLSAMFPSARVGFGELGISSGGTTTQKVSLMNQFYSMQQIVPRYVGGYFWWYWTEDRTNVTFESALRSAISSSPLNSGVAP